MHVSYACHGFEFWFCVYYLLAFFLFILINHGDRVSLVFSLFSLFFDGTYLPNFPQILSSE